MEGLLINAIAKSKVKSSKSSSKTVSDSSKGSGSSTSSHSRKTGLRMYNEILKDRPLVNHLSAEKELQEAGIIGKCTNADWGCLVDSDCGGDPKKDRCEGVTKCPCKQAKNIRNAFYHNAILPGSKKGEEVPWCSLDNKGYNEILKKLNDNVVNACKPGPCTNIARLAETNQCPVACINTKKEDIGDCIKRFESL